MDRIDKILLVLPFIPLADMVSTHFSLSLGSKEAGILGKLIYEVYDELGLVAWSIFLSFVFLACVWFLRSAKRSIIKEQASRRVRVYLAVMVNVVFMGEAYLMGGIIQNFFVPFLPPLTLHAIWAMVLLTYFGAVSFFTGAEMRQLIRS